MGIVIGAACGAVQLYLLALAARSIASGKIKIWAFVLQFLCPLAGLAACAFAARQQLAACGCVIAGILVIGAFVIYLSSRRGGGKGRR